MSIELVTRAQRGDHAAFDALAGSVGHRLYAVAWRILRDPYAAEDAVQEALVRAWRDLPRLRDPERFDAWMHRLVVNACADQGRRIRRRREDVREVPPQTAGDMDPLDALATRDELERAFLKLDVRHRAVLVLVLYVGMTAAEAAQILGIPTGTVHSRLHYALPRIRGHLAERTADAGGAER